MLESANILCHQGLYGKAAKILSSNGLAPSNRKTYEDIISLHPEEQDPILPVTDELCLGYQLSEEVISDILSSFPKATAAGASLVYPEHLSNAIRAKSLSSPESHCKNLPAKSTSVQLRLSKRRWPIFLQRLSNSFEEKENRCTTHCCRRSFPPSCS